jgi:hypothetical protein
MLYIGFCFKSFWPFFVIFILISIINLGFDSIRIYNMVITRSMKKGLLGEGLDEVLKENEVVEE